MFSCTGCSDKVQKDRVRDQCRIERRRTDIGRVSFSIPQLNLNTCCLPLTLSQKRNKSSIQYRKVEGSQCNVRYEDDLMKVGERTGVCLARFTQASQTRLLVLERLLS